MENFRTLFLSSIIIFLLITTDNSFCDASDQERQVYIVYMGALPEGEYSPSFHHANILQEVVDISFVQKSLVRSYTRSFNGFAAYLTEQEREKISRFDGVVSVFPSRTFELQTTRSWDFMGFSDTVPRSPTFESDIIIGVIDSGIWPESESFSDVGFGPIPKKWKGACKGGENFTCNNKIIGAREYSFDITNKNISVRDEEGHGTHTASTAAGNNVTGASFYGIAQGTARGGVPSSRIAAYKACFRNKRCPGSSILAAFDDAIGDGVDIITISLGGPPTDLGTDSIAIGSFHAMMKGILTVQSAGNNFKLGSIGSVAPWLLSAAASSTDRQIIDKVVLGNGSTVSGTAVNSFDFNGKEFPLILGADATRCVADLGRQCIPGCLDSDLVKGKIVLCEGAWGEKVAQDAGAVGVVLTGVDAYDTSLVVPFPTAVLSTKDFDSVYAYINSTRNPRGTISKSEATRNLDAPVVASFSSKGPNVFIPQILKPDLTAPGVEILAAYSPVASPSDQPPDKRSVKYNILSGTSMACPHVAGAAAYLKSLRPVWSPSAIKSALMTTAWQMNATKNPEAEFAYGAGHIDPVKAADPGLVYETPIDHYVNMLCYIGYDNTSVSTIFGANSSCPQGAAPEPKDLNYPSMAYKVNSSLTSFRVNFTRTVTNVGQSNSTYKTTVAPNSNLNVTVLPNTLSFKSLGEKISFVVTVTGKLSVPSKVSLESTSLVWSDGSHTVRSPIVVYVYDEL